MTHDYTRHGTTSLFAALEVASGKVHGRCFKHHTHLESIAFLESLARRYPRRDLHLICDNYGAHKHPAVGHGLAAHPRFHLHFSPTSASWLNLVERWFALTTGQAIRRGSFDSVGRPERAIIRWLQHWNENAQPFRWTKSAAAIKLLAKRYCYLRHATPATRYRIWRFTIPRINRTFHTARGRLKELRDLTARPESPGALFGL